MQFTFKKLALTGGVALLLLWAVFHHRNPIHEDSRTAQYPVTIPLVSSDPETAKMVEDLQGQVQLFKGCDKGNNGPFDGKLLYHCVYNLARLREYVLVDSKERQDFARWEHKHDNDGVLEDKEQALKAIQEMVTSLHQMHTDFLDPAEFAVWKNASEATLDGIGAGVVQIGVESKVRSLGDDPKPDLLKEALRVTADTPVYFYPEPIAGMPASLSGVKVGDRLKEVDGQPVLGLTLTEVLKRVQGKPGTQVSILVERKDGNGSTEVQLNVTRGKVNVPLVKAQTTTDNGGGKIAELTLAAFQSKDLHINIGQTLFKLCTGTLLTPNAAGGIDFPPQYDPDQGDCHLSGMIIDLRNDGGGRVDFATMIPQLLLDHGPLVSTFERKGDQIVETKLELEPNTLVKETFVDGELKSAIGSDRFMRLVPSDLPIVVLINGHSASASEMLAGLLKRHGALIVGTPSYGKEVGQQLMPLAFGTAFKPTVLKFKPGDESLGAAVMPDVEIEQSVAYLDDPMTQPDVQLEKARQVLSEQIAHLAKMADRQKAVYAEHAKRDDKKFKERDTQIRN